MLTRFCSRSQIFWRLAPVSGGLSPPRNRCFPALCVLSLGLPDLGGLSSGLALSRAHRWLGGAAERPAWHRDATERHAWQLKGAQRCAQRRDPASHRGACWEKAAVQHADHLYKRIRLLG